MWLRSVPLKKRRQSAVPTTTKENSSVNTSQLCAQLLANGETHTSPAKDATRRMAGRSLKEKNRWLKANLTNE